MTGAGDVGQTSAPASPPKVGYYEGSHYRGGKPISQNTVNRRDAQLRHVKWLRFHERQLDDRKKELTSWSWAAPRESWNEWSHARVMLHRAKDRNPVIRRVRERVAARKAKV